MTKPDSPLDNLISNTRRAQRAQNALRFYVEKQQRQKFEDNTDEITDLMVDLLHLGDISGYHPLFLVDALRIAQNHFREEKLEEEGE